MSDLYFACTDCKVYVDAGYRWALWWLDEPGIVNQGKRVSVESVLGAREYWNPSKTESADWLYKEVLPSVRHFLGEHKHHCIVFENTANFLLFEGEGFLDWMQVGFQPQLLPRYFVEQLGLKTWDQVRDFIATQEAAPWWWLLEWEGLHDKARKKFQELIRSRNSSRQIVCARTCAE